MRRLVPVLLISCCALLAGAPASAVAYSDADAHVVLDESNRLTPEATQFLLTPPPDAKPLQDALPKPMRERMKNLVFNRLFPNVVRMAPTVVAGTIVTWELCNALLRKGCFVFSRDDRDATASSESPVVPNLFARESWPGTQACSAPGGVCTFSGPLEDVFVSGSYLPEVQNDLGERCGAHLQPGLTTMLESVEVTAAFCRDRPALPSPNPSRVYVRSARESTSYDGRLADAPSTTNYPSGWPFKSNWADLIAQELAKPGNEDLRDELCRVIAPDRCVDVEWTVVPGYSGMTAAEYAAALSAAGLTGEEVLVPSTGEFPEGYVQELLPRSGTRVRRGSRVEYKVAQASKRDADCKTLWGDVPRLIAPVLSGNVGLITSTFYNVTYPHGGYKRTIELREGTAIWGRLHMAWKHSYPEYDPGVTPNERDAVYYTRKALTDDYLPEYHATGRGDNWNYVIDLPAHPTNPALQCQRLVGVNWDPWTTDSSMSYVGVVTSFVRAKSLLN